MSSFYWFFGNLKSEELRAKSTGSKTFYSMLFALRSRLM